jgi:thioredoxin 1
MKSSWLSIVVLVVLVIAGGVWLTTRGNDKPSDAGTPPGPADTSYSQPTSGPHNAQPPDSRTGLPRLIDLGAKTCIPCKMMAPILDDLRRNYADQFITEFIDVRENPRAGRTYDIQVIPTQIFFDAAGRERYRHEGFLSKEAILAKWKELGVAVR